MHLAQTLSLKPYLEYTTMTGYNFRSLNHFTPYNAGDIDLIRKLHGGPDEQGFLCVHVAMV